jgi:hypothetical protein
MINALYEMEDDEQSQISPGMLMRQSSQLLKGLEAVQGQLESVSDLDTKSLLGTKIYDLRRVIDILDEMVRLNQEEVKEREQSLYKSFFDVKRDAKAILETLTHLDSKGREREEDKSTGRRPSNSAFDIGLVLQDVLGMIEALGRPDDDDLESVMSPKDIKSRSLGVLTGLSSVLVKLEAFLESGAYAANVTGFGTIIGTLEGHITTLRRITKVLRSIRDSPLDEVEMAVFQEYGSYGDLQQDAREVMESIYAIQFGDDPKLLSPRKAESKSSDAADAKAYYDGLEGKEGKEGKDGRDFPRDEFDVKSGLNYSASYEHRFNEDDFIVANTFDSGGGAMMDFGFDFGAVMGMLHDLGADEDDDQDTTLSPQDVRKQGVTMAKGIEQVLETISPSMRGRRSGMRSNGSNDSLNTEESKRSIYKDQVIEDAIFDLKKVGGWRRCVLLIVCLLCLLCQVCLPARQVPVPCLWVVIVVSYSASRRIVLPSHLVI